MSKEEDIKKELEEGKEAVTEKASEVKEKVEDAAAGAKEKAAEAVKDKAAQAVKKGPDKKFIIGAIVAVCAIAAVIAMIAMNGGDKSLYGKISNYDDYVKLGKYKGLEYTAEKVKVTDKEVKTEIDQRLAAKATTEDSKKGTVKDGDNINISYVGKIDGKKFDGGSNDNQTLTIGSGSIIPGFEDGLIGKKVGEKVTLDLTFPKNYHEKSLRKKKAKFEVTINSKQVTKTPKYDVEFIKANSEYDNKKDYEASVKKDLTKTKEETAKETAKQTLWSQVIEASEVKKYPEDSIKTEQEAIITQYKQMAESYNMDWKEFLKTYMNSTEKKFEKESKTYAESVAKQKLVLNSIADKEKLEISNSDYKKRVKELLKGANMTEKQFEEQYKMTIEKYAEENDFRSNFLMQDVMDFIFKNAKAK